MNNNLADIYLIQNWNKLTDICHKDDVTTNENKINKQKGKGRKTCH